MDDDSPVARALAGLTTEQKHELAALGITPQKRSDWVNTGRKPTVAQLKTLAIITGRDLAPMLEWLANEQATPEQLDLFLRALAKATAAVAVVILSGAGNHADAASMRVPEPNAAVDGTHIMRRWWCRLAARCRRLAATFKAPSWGLFCAWSTTDIAPC